MDSTTLPDVVAILLTCLPLFALAGGGVGYLLAHRVRMRELGLQQRKDQAAAEATITAAAANIIEARAAEWKDIYGTMQTTLRISQEELAQVKSQYAKLEARFEQAQLKHASDMAVRDLRDLECQALVTALTHRVEELLDARPHRRR